MMNAGPSCPIYFKSKIASGSDHSSLMDHCLTAAEIEWRRWSEWQLQRTALKRLKRQRLTIGS